MVTNRKTFLFLVAIAGGCFGGQRFWLKLFAAEAEHATLIREESLYGSAGANAQKTAQVERGSALTILERSQADGQPWVKISMAADQQAQVSKEVTGWLPAKAVVTAATANGDEIIFGQAVDSERQAEERGGRKGAAEDAWRLYSRVAELFPGSPLAAEATVARRRHTLAAGEDGLCSVGQADGRKISERGHREVSAVEAGGAGRVRFAR